MRNGKKFIKGQQQAQNSIKEGDRSSILKKFHNNLRAKLSF